MYILNEIRANFYYILCYTEVWIIKGLTSHDVKCTHLQPNEDEEQHNSLPLTLSEKYY